MTTESVTRYVGFCPICEGYFKLAPKPGVINDELCPAMSLVHHGYKRPGWGHIIGDCFAVGWQPYELSTLVCSAWRDKMQSWLEATERTLQRLRDPGLDTLYVTISCPFHKALHQSVTSAHDFARKYRWNPEAAYYEDMSLWVRRNGDDFEKDIFIRSRYKRIVEAERDIKTARDEIARMDKFIDNWQLENVRTEQEQVERDKAKRAAERAAKDAEKQAARDAKEAKRRELDEKKARWEKERADLIQMYRDLFTNLAKQPKHAGTRMAAMEFWRAMNKARNKKGYLRFYPRDLDIDDALIALELARAEPRGNEKPWMNYAYDSGVLA